MTIKGITITSDEHEQFFKRSLRVFLHNGYTVSIVYGTGLYSHTLSGTRHGEKPEVDASIVTEPEASSVEIAVLDSKGNFVGFTDGDTVRGYTDLKTVGDIIAWAAALPSTVTA